MPTQPNHHPTPRFNVGDLVRLKATGEIGVIRVINGDFATVEFPSDTRRVLKEGLERIGKKTPIELLEEGELSDSRAYGLRLQAAYLRHAYRFDPKSGLSNARVEPKLHQVLAAHWVVSKLFPRMILADEVGLGKTIEAGLIVKELRARQIVDRVLVVCPASLQHQWKYEMETKFGEKFEIYNRERVNYHGREGSNPWEKERGIICSYEFAVRLDNMKQIVDAKWGLVIFDEAHRVRRKWVGKRKEETKAYMLASLLQDKVIGLIMLTATPMQLHPYELYSLIELIDFSLHVDYAGYKRKSWYIPILNNTINELQEWTAVPEAERTEVAEHLNFLITDLLEYDTVINVEILNDKNWRDKLIQDIVKLHPLAQALIRNRKLTVGGFLGRIAHRVSVDLTEQEIELYNDISEYIRLSYDRANREQDPQKRRAIGFTMTIYQKLLTSSSCALRESFRNRVEKLRIQDNEKGRKATISEENLEEMGELDDISEGLDHVQDTNDVYSEREAEIKELEGYIKRLDQISDSKADKLVNDLLLPILEKNPAEKILIFTGFINTQTFLQRVLQSVGWEVTIFNGKMNLSEKESSVQRFRRQAQIMITTEAGGEGRNFQFAHIMVNYDLPWNPMKVEQRIGRLDRIGQAHQVQIYNLYNKNTLEERVLDVLEYRIELFEESVGSLEPILGRVAQDLERIISKHMDNLDKHMEDFGEELEKQIEKARLAEETLSEFILDSTFFRQDEANQFLERPTLASLDDLKQFVQDVLEYYGGRLASHSGSYHLTLSRKLASALKVVNTSVRGVFDPHEALEWEDLDFFAFGHKHIDQIVSYVYNQEARTSIRFLPDAPSDITLEVLYEYRSQGSLHAKGQMIRHLIGHDLQIHSEMITTIPVIGQSVTREINIPQWLPNALEVSGRKANEDLERFRKKINEELSPERREFEERYRLVFTHRYKQAKVKIDKQRAWIDEIQQHGSDQDRRALPLRLDELDTLQQERRQLISQYRQKIKDLNYPVSIEQEIVSAGLVVGK